jgi:hypothetical protein
MSASWATCVFLIALALLLDNPFQLPQQRLPGAAHLLLDQGYAEPTLRAFVQLRRPLLVIRHAHNCCIARGYFWSFAPEAAAAVNNR